MLKNKNIDFFISFIGPKVTETCFCLSKKEVGILNQLNNSLLGIMTTAKQDNFSEQITLIKDYLNYKITCLNDNNPKDPYYEIALTFCRNQNLKERECLKLLNYLLLEEKRGFNNKINHINSEIPEIMLCSLSVAKLIEERKQYYARRSELHECIYSRNNMTKIPDNFDIDKHDKNFERVYQYVKAL